jgi:choline dehydrogenase-like flavoprotein
MLGGSSGINYEMYVRGSDQDFDDWATIVDDPAWGSANMKHYMRKHQTVEPADQSVERRNAMPVIGEYHGTSGPVHTSFVSDRERACVAAREVRIADLMPPERLLSAH